MKAEDKKNDSANKSEERAKEVAHGNKVNPQKDKKDEIQKNKDKETILELTESLQRLQAEFENYKKRVEKEKQEVIKYAKAELILKLLGIIDTFEIALKNANDHGKFVKGIELIYAQIMSTLDTEGLRPIEAAGKKFDPYLHEVMLKQKSDKENGIILEELQRGYMLNDKVLRFSKVKTSEKHEENNS